MMREMGLMGIWLGMKKKARVVKVDGIPASLSTLASMISVHSSASTDTVRADKGTLLFAGDTRK
jgi:hypothetical protein